MQQQGKTSSLIINDFRFNWKTIPRGDNTLDAKTNKYGKATMCKPHPCINDKMWSTTFR